ncbi:hypothetical protein IE53DRAFT_388079 [Violaceomyces palustris]|uniref:Uncharacterized protein n=1 Tax=Violaceomyces palustris TaxID=1673888 RepID=A0ACD0NV54_9BASI|nr:hypothetical protein IE53DRAFT_388079 [Violaceomyces palustris]
MIRSSQKPHLQGKDSKGSVKQEGEEEDMPSTTRRKRKEWSERHQEPNPSPPPSKRSKKGGVRKKLTPPWSKEEDAIFIEMVLEAFKPDYAKILNRDLEVNRNSPERVKDLVQLRNR